MAEFCSKCEPEYWDVDLVQIALSLEPGHSASFLCEGCNTRGIYKDESGLIFLAIKEHQQIKLKQTKIEDL